MTRRTAVGSLLAGGAATAAVQAPKLIKPSVLRAGDLAGIISPSTQVTDPEKLALADRTLSYFGLKTKWASNVRTHRAQGVATVDERVEDLHSMFRDPDVKAVFCIRGGYGAAQLLDRLDYGLIAANPKVFIGYSDITALHLGIHQKTGLVTFHGPVLLSQFTPYTQDCFHRALFKTRALGPLGNPKEENQLRPTHRIRTIRSGRASGRLIGGNLTLISTLMGTPFEINTKESVFFTEDVGEEPYRIDRMLTQLRLAGKLTDAAGIIFGECLDCRPNDYKPSSAWNLTFGEVLDDRFFGVERPIFSGLTIGHTDDQLTLPLGIRATLEADQCRLIIEESATS